MKPVNMLSSTYRWSFYKNTGGGGWLSDTSQSWKLTGKGDWTGRNRKRLKKGKKKNFELRKNLKEEWILNLKKTLIYYMQHLKVSVERPK